MNLVIPISVLACLVAGSGLWLLVRRVALATGALPPTADWIDELSLDRYQPMLRLLNEEELQFLRTQPGFTSALASRYRRQRCQIFRGYLQSLRNDFNRITGAMVLLMSQAGNDRPDLAFLLVRSRLAFAWGMAAVHLRLWLYVWGVGTVRPERLIERFNRMRLELRSLIPAAAPAAA
jgi:hypothetical protein